MTVEQDLDTGEQRSRLDPTELIDSRIQARELVPDRHRRIAEAALPLFTDQGFHSTTVQMVARAAGMSMGSLYQYIRQKDDLLYLVGFYVINDLLAVIPDKRPGETNRDLLARSLVELFGFAGEHHRWIRLMYRESASLKGKPEQLQAVQDLELDVVRRLQSIIDDGIEDGSVQECDSFLLAYDLLMFVHLWAIKGWAVRRHMSFDEFRDRQLEAAMRIVPGA